MTRDGVQEKRVVRVAVCVHPDDGPEVLPLFAAALPGARSSTRRSAGAGCRLCGRWVFADETLFAQQRTMKAVFTFGAGVNGVLALPDLPRDVPLIRLEDAGMAEQMVRYVLRAVLRIARPLRRLRAPAARRCMAAARSASAVIDPRRRAGTGRHRRRDRAGAGGAGLSRSRHARTARTLDGVDCYAGDAGFDAFLTGLDVLVARGAADAGDARNPEPPHACASGRRRARDQHRSRRTLVEDTDLLALLETASSVARRSTCSIPSRCRLRTRSGRHPRVTVTPHVSGTTLPDEAVAQIAAKILRLERASR